MRSHLPDFETLVPGSLDEALGHLARDPRTTPLAGATDLYVLLNAGHLEPGPMLSLHAIAELREPIRFDGNRVTFGALTTYTDTRRHPEVARRLPLMPLAARELGALQIQNRATWAGNIANASPAADGVPALLAYDGEVELASVRGRRWVALESYFHGYKKTERARDELIVRIAVTVPADTTLHRFRKVGTRRMQAISKVVLAAAIARERDGRVTRARIALGSVAPVTLRARSVEEALVATPPGPERIERAVAAVLRDIAPIDDLRSTLVYRQRVTENLIRELAHELEGPV